MIEADRPGSPFGPMVQMVHIPKTGGTYLEELLTKWAKRKMYQTARYYYRSMADAETWDCPQVRPAGLLFGHRHFGFCKRFADRYMAEDMVFIVSVRHPVSRLVSEFDYLMRNIGSNPQLAEWTQAKNISEVVIAALTYNKDVVPAWVNKVRKMCNLQTKFLSAPFISPARLVEAKSALEVAMRNLDRADVVVVQEHMSSQLAPQLKYVFGTDEDDDDAFDVHQRANANPHAPSPLSAEARALVEACSSDDLALYHRAVQRSHQLTLRAQHCIIV